MSETLGEILAASMTARFTKRGILKQQERRQTMLKFDVTIDFTGAKLHAIKTIRSALDIGLKEAKDATERFGTDTTYTTITLNAAQFANLYWFVQEENWRLNSDSYAITKRQLVITTVNRYEEPDKNVFDFSGLFQPLS